MKKVLQINETPFLHGYSHTASFMSIAMEKARFTKSDISVSDLKWKYESGYIQDFYCYTDDKTNETCSKKISRNVEKIGNCYDVFLGRINDREFDSVFFYNSIKGLKSFEFKLDAIKEVCRWSMAGAEINSGSIKNPSCVFRAMFLPMNNIRITKVINESEYTYEIKNSEECQYMKIDISDIINVQISTKGQEWNSIYKCDYYFDSSARVGFFSWIGNDCFKNWFFTNFIQLHCSKDLEDYYDVKLNYYIPAFLNYRHHMSNPWLKQHYIPKEYVASSKGIMELIRFCLKKNKYISLNLNERFIPGTWAYRVKDYEHENMVYGLNDESEQLFLMGYNKSQRFKAYTLSYNDFFEAYTNSDTKDDLVLLEYQIPEATYTLNTERIVSFLKEYLTGKNSSYRDTLIYDEIDWAFGIKIYDVMVNNIEKTKDYRISYLLYEHKMIMTERVKYLHVCRLINEEDYLNLWNMSKNIEELSRDLMMVCIKYNMTSEEKLGNLIKDSIRALKKEDRCFIKSLINCLTTKSVIK